MENNHPQITAHGVDFSIDIAKHEIYRTDNPALRINLSEQWGINSEYVVNIDAETKQLSPYPFDPFFRVPSICKLDPKSFSEHYQVPTDILQYVDDRLAMLQRPEIIERVRFGKQPVIGIAGQPYYVNYMFSFLEAKGPFAMAKIHFDQLDKFPVCDFGKNANVHLVPIDANTQEIAQLDLSSAQELPDHIVVAAIPHRSDLDPVGYARSRNFDVASYLLGKSYSTYSVANLLSQDQVNRLRQSMSKARNVGENLPAKQMKRSHKKGRGI